MPLLLEEEQCRSLPEERRVLYILQWLQGLPPAIRTAPKVRLVAELMWPVVRLSAPSGLTDGWKFLIGYEPNSYIPLGHSRPGGVEDMAWSGSVPSGIYGFGSYPIRNFQPSVSPLGAELRQLLPGYPSVLQTVLVWCG